MNKEKTPELVELEHRIADLRARLPRHSVPAAMLIELEDLEEALLMLQEQQAAEELPDQSDR